MSFSTPVDNFVPVGHRNVDKWAGLGSAVDKPVNDGEVCCVSTGLSTLLITYIRVVQASFLLQMPSNSAILASKPTTFSPAVDNFMVGGCY